ncbi:rhodanese-like domain-containing protein [Methylobacillus sp.]|uniref:rhodanese-like domain-containing protein n=1 Tax=Methylobacillus sp. TaxID=56818 RepID=UPI002FDF51CF
METLSSILQNARVRAEQHGLPYAGALTPKEAQKVLEMVPVSKLVDVRTKAELDLVGRIPGAAHIEWAFYPGMSPNPDFLMQLDKQVDREALVMFLCRTGGRSHNAAVVAAQNGYTEAYNVLEGFEGEATPDNKQRGQINGWKAARLPWTNA